VNMADMKHTIITVIHNILSYNLYEYFFMYSIIIFFYVLLSNKKNKGKLLNSL